MNSCRVALRRAGHGHVRWSSQQGFTARRQWPRYNSGTSQDRSRRHGGNAFAQAAVYAGVFGLAAAGAYYYPKLKESFSPDEASIEPSRAQPKFEKSRKKAVSKEDNRDIISSQHLQVKNSWERPGVYAWGSNSGKVIDQDSNEKYVKLPRRISFFNDQILRDLKLTRSFGAAVNEKGDLIQWGLGFSGSDPRPVTTLTGKDLAKIQVSNDRIIALSRNGDVYSIPSSRDDLEGGVKETRQKSSWSLWSSAGKEAVNFRNLTPSGLSWGERITDISSGLEHCIMLTSKGRVFTAASSAIAYPSKGQLGIAGLTWETRPKGPYDQPHELLSLKGFEATAIAAGDRHSVILDKLGRIFSFGDNTFGQLGFTIDSGLPYATTPAMVSVDKLYAASGMVPRVTSIKAGGDNTFFTVDAGAPTAASESQSMAPAKRMPGTTSDLWACGQGVAGTLGTGKWTHVSTAPAKIKALSSLFEFDEETNKNVPIKLKALSVGSTHCAAVMDNITKTDTSSKGTENETNWGADVLFWGGNEYYQLGTGKRTNMNTPTYIGPLDGGEGDANRGREGEVHRLCLTPKQTVRIGEGGRGRKVTLEQKVECGRLVTGVYSAV
ncbi:rRNA processing protein [Metarhizium album ARSEF 1941]|uniref:rRNA processing protein n=1 Tax=Metarhizium album (strain ARSEF 1941) TaxID=1081103 RepID=A0A0B2X6U0_METAS|nr:rRNA processing protein [Metarhizium album ARSEF 1941]KHO01011.1 rRNA processing protein [Metarhizium album ARSEF 1941]